MLNIFDFSELSILDSAGGSLLFGLDELADKYKTFEVRSEQAVPLAFWLTSKAKIILLEKQHDMSDNLIDYHIHAEPI